MWVLIQGQLYLVGSDGVPRDTAGNAVGGEGRMQPVPPSMVNVAKEGESGYRAKRLEQIAREEAGRDEPAAQGEYI